jgi:cytochrome c-type biogenesis protein CcmF
LAKIGFFFLLLSFSLSLGLTILSVSAILQKRRNFVRDIGYLGFTLVFITITGASLILLLALWENQFSIEYVYSYSSTDLPLFYRLTAFWAGQEGSLLLWTWLLSLFALVYYSKRKREKLSLSSFPFVTGVQTFLLLLLLIPANPFKELSFSPAEGEGLNPLLQNIGMVFHPPSIFLGFAAYTIPFALAMAALISRRIDENWIFDSRRWALLAWLFLGIGNVLGAWWAYVELGWGGYWAWDPVENASLLPWLTGAALIHSLNVYSKKKILRVWTFLLVIFTFTLCVFGTYLTRSGVLSTSVHSFAPSIIGVYFLAFIALLFVVSFYFLFRRYKELVGEPIKSYLSREGAFSLTNWFFVLFTIIVLWGTMLPLLTKVFSNKEQTLERGFFDTFTAPIIYLLAFFIGFCVYLVWKKFNFKETWGKISTPLFLSLPFTVAFIYAFPRNIIGWIGFFLGSFSFISTLNRWYVDVKERSKAAKESFWDAFKYLFSKNRSRYGAFIAHLGVLLMFFGVIASTLYKGEVQKKLFPGESFKFEDVTLKYERPFQEKGPNFEAVGVSLTYFNGNVEAGKLKPMIAYYPHPGTRSAEVSVKWGFWRDVYVALSQVMEDGSAVVVLDIEPLVSWIWIGSVILLIGIIVAWWPGKNV